MFSVDTLRQALHVSSVVLLVACTIMLNVRGNEGLVFSMI